MEIGQTLELEYHVLKSDLAKALSSHPEDDFPEVFATSRMIAIMELAAARLMKPLLGEGSLSVGVNVNVTHLAATLQDEMVKATAKFVGKSGKVFNFEVQVEDNGGVVGKGSHTRVIVSTERLIEGAQKRNTKN